MRRLYIVCIWEINLDFLLIALLVVSKDGPSHHLFVLHIHDSEQIIAKFVKGEGREEFVIGNVVIMLLLYVDDVGYN